MEIFDVNQYNRIALPRPQFYIQDILPKQGAMLLYGEPKVRKSWLAQYMAFCLATGTEFLGFRTEQTRTFIGNFEISPNSYAYRLRDMEGIGGTAHFAFTDGFIFAASPMLMYLDEEENFNDFRASLRRIQPKVIIIDCMAAAFGGDENDGADVAQFIEKLSVLKAEFEASIVLVHHTNKTALMGSTERARGHSRLTGWVDTLCFMFPQPTGVQLQIKARQASREIPNTNIVFEDFIWHLR